ncbi:helix-turn-helix domain-containing protein [Paraglaciecola sp. 2405UD69-4]|uniref:helix-turn-helix domain-containing protein n=1 Tax=Paraglaciecola sp. 2405UD69-4 TaxID=3391836 RepID=UPI0039C907FA
MTCIEKTRHSFYKVKIHQQKISGVLHQAHSAKQYQLRRYLPAPSVSNLVEQFWLVDWDLTNSASHTQENLPDPNMHLVIDSEGCRVMGPVSKKYSYKMTNKARVVGVKFNIGVLAKQLSRPMSQAVDKTLSLEEVFQHHIELISNTAFTKLDDQAMLTKLSDFLVLQSFTNSPTLLRVQRLITTIKEHHSITKVEQLAQQSNMSVRSIQRLFEEYVGLSPKWLIRKYRLRRALDLLEAKQATLTELAAQLDYSDQSHLIRDFKVFLNITPSQYR